MTKKPTALVLLALYIGMFVFCISMLSASSCHQPPGPPPADTTIIEVVIDDASHPPEPEPADAGPKDIYDFACANLSEKHCKEGTRYAGEDTCANVLRRSEMITDTDAPCLARALTLQAIRACADGHRYCKTLVP